MRPRHRPATAHRSPAARRAAARRTEAQRAVMRRAEARRAPVWAPMPPTPARPTGSGTHAAPWASPQRRNRTLPRLCQRPRHPRCPRRPSCDVTGAWARARLPRAGRSPPTALLGRWRRLPPGRAPARCGGPTRTADRNGGRPTPSRRSRPRSWGNAREGRPGGSRERSVPATSRTPPTTGRIGSVQAPATTPVRQTPAPTAQRSGSTVPPGSPALAPSRTTMALSVVEDSRYDTAM
jgi:hypothetical protein